MADTEKNIEKAIGITTAVIGLVKLIVSLFGKNKDKQNNKKGNCS